MGHYYSSSTQDKDYDIVPTDKEHNGFLLDVHAFKFSCNESTRAHWIHRTRAYPSPTENFKSELATKPWFATGILKPS